MTRGGQDQEQYLREHSHTVENTMAFMFSIGQNKIKT